MSPEIWLLFVATEAVLCLTPGPAVLTVFSHGIRRGSRAGMWVAAGVLLANALYFAISATGLFALLIAWYEIFFLIKWLGAAYLIWIGIQTWRTHPTKLTDSTDSTDPTKSPHAIRTTNATARSEPAKPASPFPPAGWKAGRRGFAVQAANPKTLLFFGALLPQFIDPANAIHIQFAILGATSIAIEFCVLAMYATLASQAARLAQQPKLETWINRAGGSLLIAAGAGLATIRR